jgi:hypothetical protein
MIDVAFRGGMAEVLGEPDESTFDGHIPEALSGVAVKAGCAARRTSRR